MAQLRGSGENSISFSRDFVFYNDKNSGTSPFWESIRKDEIEYGNYIYEIYVKDRLNIRDMLERGKQQLLDMAAVERAKEENCLRTIDPQFPSGLNETSYIRTLNLTYRNKDQFKATIERIIAAINYAKEKNYRAPTMFSWFINYFNQAFRKNIVAQFDKNIDAFLANDDSMWDKIISKSIDEAFVRIEQSGQKETKDHDKQVYGLGSDYAGLADLMKDNVFFQDLLMSQLKINEVREKTKDWVMSNSERLKKSLNKRRPRFTKAQLERWEGAKDRERNIQGYLWEVLATQMTVEAQKEKNKHVQIQALNVSSNIGATDAGMSIAKIGCEVDFNEIYTTYTEALDGKTQEQISQQMLQWYNHLKGGTALDHLFIINTSNKLYSMSHNHSFSKTANIEDAAKVLKTNFSQSNKPASVVTPLADRMFTSEKEINSIVALFYNTLNGAFLENRSQQVKDLIRELFVVAAGSLLFSDYIMVGRESTTNTDMIHLFDLNGVYVPLSVVLKGLGEAYSNQSLDGGQYLYLTYFRKGSGILYPNKGDGDRYDGKSVSEAFREQRQRVQDDSKFSIHFVNNFREIVSQIAANI